MKTTESSQQQNTSKLSSDSNRWLNKESLDYSNNPLPDTNGLEYSLEYEIKLLALEAKKLEVENAKQSQSLKEEIFYWVKMVATSYLVFVGLVIISLSCPYFVHNDKTWLSDNVLMTLLATTTATIIGLPALIIHSLFPKDKTKKKPKKIIIN